MGVLSGVVCWGGGGRGEVASEAREDGGIRRGGGAAAGAEQVGRGGVGRSAIEWRHQARHRPAPPRPRPHLRAVPAWEVGRCAAAAPRESRLSRARASVPTPKVGWPATELGRERETPARSREVGRLMMVVFPVVFCGLARLD